MWDINNIYGYMYVIIINVYNTYKVNVASWHTLNYQSYVEMNLAYTVVKDNLYFAPIYTHIKKWMLHEFVSFEYNFI